MNEPHPILGTLHQFDGQLISWVGMCPWTSNLAFGTETGDFMAPVGDDASKAVNIASDAVNGAAFAGRFAAFSSRASIQVARQSATTGALTLPVVRQDRGAHGVVSSAHGAFFFAAGPDGILAAYPHRGRDEFEVQLLQAEAAPIYAYEAIRVGRKDADDVLAFAARNDGVFVLLDRGNGQFVSGPSHRFIGRDIVAITPVNDARFPLGVVALSDRGDLLLIPDVTAAKSLGALNYPQICGRPYTVCAAAGHLFVLTSSELVAIPDGVAHLADVHEVRQQGWFLPVEATDIVCVGDERLFLIADGAAEELSVEDLVEPSGAPVEGNGRPTQSRQLSPRGMMPSLEASGWQGLSLGLVVSGAGVNS